MKVDVVHSSPRVAWPPLSRRAPGCLRSATSEATAAPASDSQGCRRFHRPLPHRRAQSSCSAASSSRRIAICQIARRHPAVPGVRVVDGAKLILPLSSEHRRLHGDQRRDQILGDVDVAHCRSAGKTVRDESWSTSTGNAGTRTTPGTSAHRVLSPATATVTATVTPPLRYASTARQSRGSGGR